MRHFCGVHGCKREGRHSIDLRVRRPDTSAIVAPRTGVYLCDKHATAGLDIDIEITPRRTKKVQVTTSVAGTERYPPTVRMSEIVQGAERT